MLCYRHHQSRSRNPPPPPGRQKPRRDHVIKDELSRKEQPTRNDREQRPNNPQNRKKHPPLSEKDHKLQSLKDDLRYKMSLKDDSRYKMLPTVNLSEEEYAEYGYHHREEQHDSNSDLGWEPISLYHPSSLQTGEHNPIQPKMSTKNRELSMQALIKDLCK